MSPGTVFVKCKVLPGLFDTEFYILINSSSAYVNQANVKFEGTVKQGAEIDGKVFAYVIQQNKDHSLIELSGEPIVGGLRTWVANTQIDAA